MFLENGLFRVLRDEVGEGTEGGGGNPPAKTFTQEQVNAFLAKEKKAFQSKLSEYEERLKGFDEIKSEFEKVKEEKDLAGKSALEKLEHKHAKDLGLLQKKIEELSAGIAERDGLVKKSESTLFEERLGRTLGDELGKAKVLSQSIGKAARLARMDLQEVKHEDGKWVATYGDLIDKPIGEVVAAWAKDNPEFLPAPTGGAGTRSPNGRAAPANLWDLDANELLSLDAKQRAVR